MKKVNSDNLVELLKKHNKEALRYLIDNYSNSMLKVCYSVLRDVEASKECVNDVFLKIWNNVESFDKDKSKFNTWVVVLCKYTSIDYIRKNKKHIENVFINEALTEDTRDFYDELETKENLSKVILEINNMNKASREIFVRRFFLNERIKVIAEKLGMTEAAVGCRILRERKKLKSKFEEVI